MSTVLETQPKQERSTLYIIALVVFAALVVIALLTWRTAKTNEEAQTKADQLIAELSAVGARTPSKDMVVHVLGDDGGAVCANPNNALNKAALFAQLVNGAGGPGTRPVIADGRVLKGELLIIKVYCPDELAGFQELVNSLKTANVAGG